MNTKSPRVIFSLFSTGSIAILILLGQYGIRKGCYGGLVVVYRDHEFHGSSVDDQPVNYFDAYKDKYCDSHNGECQTGPATWDMVTVPAVPGSECISVGVGFHGSLVEKFND